MDRGQVGRHGSYVRAMTEKVVQDGVPDDMSAPSVLDKATVAKNILLTCAVGVDDTTTSS